MAGMQTIQMLGLIGAASYLAARLARASGRAAFHRYAIVAQPRSGLPAMPRGFRVEELEAEDLAEHVIDAGPEVQAQRFAEGLSCLAVFDAKDQLTGLVWLREATYREDEVAARFVLPAQSCWDTGLWIAPEHRMGRSFAALWAGVGAWMDARGLSHSFSRISDYNLPALKSHQRMGAKVLIHFSFARLGNWQWCRTARPRLVRLDGGREAVVNLAPLVTQTASVSAS